jgi:hypothetical protein
LTPDRGKGVLKIKMNENGRPSCHSSLSEIE